MLQARLWQTVTLSVGLCLALALASGGFVGAAPDAGLHMGSAASIRAATGLPALDDPAYRWSLTLDWSLPTEDPAGQPLVYQPAAMTQLDGGTIVVVDGASPHLVVIDPAARRVLRRFGRQGHGPGELSGDYALVWAGPEGDPWVADRGNQRVTHFRLDGSVVSERSMIGLGGARGIGLWQVFAGTTDIVVQVWLVTDFATNALADSLARLDLATGQMHMFMALPARPPPGARIAPLFAPRSLWTALPSGDVIVGNTHEATFRVFGPDGAPRRDIRLGLEPRKIPEREKAEILKGYGNLRGVRASGTRRPEVGERFPVTNMLYALNDTTFAMFQGRRSPAAGRSDSMAPGFHVGSLRRRHLVPTTIHAPLVGTRPHVGHNARLAGRVDHPGVPAGGTRQRPLVTGWSACGTGVTFDNGRVLKVTMSLTADGKLPGYALGPA